MQRIFKYRLYPNRQQRETLAAQVDLCRELYNAVLQERIESYKTTGKGVRKLRAVRIKERDLEELARLAKKEDETVSSLIQRAVREFLDKEKAQRSGRPQRVEIASLQIRTSAQRRTTPQPAAVRWFVPLRLQRVWLSTSNATRKRNSDWATLACARSYQTGRWSTSSSPRYRRKRCSKR